MNYTEETMVQLDEALADKAFCEELAAAESADAFKALFLEKKGIEIDDTMAAAAFEKKEKILAGEELTEEELEMVAGGCKKCFWSYLAAGTVVGGLVGGVPGAVVGASVGCIVGVAAAIGHDIRIMKGKAKR